MCRMTEAIREEGIEQGIEQGIETGTKLVNSLNRILIDTGRYDDLARATSDPEFQQRLIEELVPAGKWPIQRKYKSSCIRTFWTNDICRY